MQRLVLSMGILASCATTATGTLSLVTGDETGVFTRPPAPTTLVVEKVSLDGGAVELSRATLPIDHVELPELATDEIAAFRVRGIGSDGATLVWGESVPFQFGLAQDGRIPVFVQRTGEFARMPGQLSDGREAPLVSVAAERFLFVAGGADSALGAALVAYDFGWLTPIDVSTTKLPRAPRSIAYSHGRLLLVDDRGASWVDLVSGLSSDATAPTGGAFSEVSGGTSITNNAGETYVVGPARTDASSARVLRVDAQGALSFAALVTARRGAAVTWVEGRGLVVAGGSAEGAGAELLGPGSTSATALPFVTDESAGATAFSLDPSHVVLVDATTSSSSPRQLDLSCSKACAATPWGRPLPPGMAPAQAFSAGMGAVVLADEANGTSHALRLSLSSTDEIRFRVDRKHARGAKLANGAIVVVGGASRIESFAP